ncbi:hypothetical protein FIBSPDRAFT_1052818 [Athelia psychrophila]|uniref:Eukaryotic translation initiation factor 3 subunit E N-terminal domain-containing protein n=1 Tax=Athelia psychrophila TaxID=1759441 RepID=A0A165WJV4_9AGAM|nr:hypothetical protein FIBSPDRAFT_1052818 [Fibularhizoctonia sp. CBS 109695]
MADYASSRENALSTNERLQQEAPAVLGVIENRDVAHVQAQRRDKAQNLQYLKDNYNFQFTYSNYSGAADYLYPFRVLSTNADLLASAHWGELASAILTGKWDVALEEFNLLRDAMDARSNVHGAVGGCGEGAAAQQDMADALESILRYLDAAAVLVRRSPSSTATPAAPTSTRVKHALKEIVKAIQTEYQCTEPLTYFLNFLYADFDFEAAQRELASASAVVQDEFFLGKFKDEFVEAARGLVSEVYVRIHQRIDIGDLSKRLNLGPEEGGSCASFARYITAFEPYHAYIFLHFL